MLFLFQNCSFVPFFLPYLKSLLCTLFYFLQYKTFNKEEQMEQMEQK